METYRCVSSSVKGCNPILTMGQCANAIFLLASGLHPIISLASFRATPALGRFGLILLLNISRRSLSLCRKVALTLVGLLSLAMCDYS